MRLLKQFLLIGIIGYLIIAFITYIKIQVSKLIKAKEKKIKVHRQACIPATSLDKVKRVKINLIGLNIILTGSGLERGYVVTEIVASNAEYIFVKAIKQEDV